MVKSFILVLMLLGLYRAGGQRVAVVKFDGRGVKGYITFTEEGPSVSIAAKLQGLRGAHGWHVHTLPVDQTVDPELQCRGPSVGPHYDPFNRNNGTGYTERCAMDRAQCEAGDLIGKFGPLMPDTPVSVTDSTGSLFLRDQFSIIGRSVVIHNSEDGSNFECGTIRSMAEGNAQVTLLQSSFVNPIGGSIYFRQVEGEDVQIWGKLYWTNDSPTTMNHNWHIHTLAPGEEYRMGYCNTSSNILGHYRPLGNGPTSVAGYNLVCNPGLTQGCEVGDLTGKHDTVTVQATPSPYSTSAFFYTDNFLNLTGVNPVLNRSVAIHEADRGGPVIACAPLIRSENIVLTQYSVEEIIMSQGSPFEDTVITSTGSRTETSLQDFAFNQLIQNCVASPNNVFSPYEPVVIPDPGVDTPDLFSVGALQTRYPEVGATTTQRVFDVPIYGASASITSLNIRAVTDAETSTCSALLPRLMQPNVVIAKASFSRVVRGAVYLIQTDFGFGQYGNTHIIVDVYYADSSTPATTNHNWHVHMNPSPPADTMCAPTVGGHYNPYNVSLATATSDPAGQNSDYSVDCSPRYQLRCESGDMTGKHGRLDISPDGPSRPTYTYVDSNLQLTGVFTIIGRSMAIHDIIDGLPIFDCGTIERSYLSEAFVIRTDPSSMLRTALTGVLAAEVDDVDATDIIVLNQEVLRVNGSDVTCVDVLMHVLGPSPEMANAYANMLRDAAEEFFTCNGMTRFTSATATAAMTTAATTSAATTANNVGSGGHGIAQATPLLPLLMAVLCIVGFAKH